MTYTYSLATDIGKVRLLIPDKVEADAFFSDEELTAMLAIETGIKRTAALCLETIASDSAMVLQVIRIQNIQTNGAEVARALLNRAVQLRKQADDDDANSEVTFDIAEYVLNDFAYRDKIYNEALKE